MSLSKRLKGYLYLIFRENKIDAVDLEKFLVNFDRLDA